MMIFARFQSTRPVWGATPEHNIKHAQRAISIHAPRVGRDPVWPQHFCGYGKISIHAPRVGRDATAVISNYKPIDFNPRAPCGARPASAPEDYVTRKISIHAPRVGRDAK